MLAALILMLSPAPGLAAGLEACAAEDPMRAEAACSRLIRSGKLSRRVLATLHYNRSVALRHSSRKAAARKGGDKLARIGLERALADASRAIFLDPAMVEPWIQRGIIRYEQGDFAGAVVDNDMAIRLSPEMAEAWNNRSLAHHRLGQDDLAKQDFDRTIRLHQYYGNAMIIRELGPLHIDLLPPARK